MAQARRPSWFEHTRVVFVELGLGMARPAPLFLYPEEGGGRPREVVEYVSWVRGDLGEFVFDETGDPDF